MPIQDLNHIHKNIQIWYKKEGRLSLPWRNTSDPYAIYISEVMLQQTQVKTVLERYYFPFLAKFPTLKILAESPLDDVLKMWEGLGYYNRAKNLHKTATLIETLPSSIDALIALPGIGKNTAHALATFAFGQAVPIMEANVKRIICRIYTLTSPNDTLLWQKASMLLDTHSPFEYNQAMMDIGATLCKPKNPLCDLCPLVSICQGKEDPTRYPTKKKRIVPQREYHMMLYAYDDSLALSQRTGKFLHGLWGFESVEVPLCASSYIGEVSHAYTHFKLRCKVYVYEESVPSQERYFSLAQIKEIAISKVDEKIVKLFLGTISL
ncbi:MAG: A/G-specific adenine glycosylase [Sulfurovum sp.]|nr:A/G-specific adenine glycosylase [Sulfurovum sp.]